MCAQTARSYQPAQRYWINEFLKHFLRTSLESKKKKYMDSKSSVQRVQQSHELMESVCVGIDPIVEFKNKTKNISNQKR